MNKIKIIWKLLFLFSVSLYSQTEIIPLQYDVSGYSTNNLAYNRANSSPLDTIPSLKAEMNVNESGALTYILPIEVLNGVNGQQPNLALGYSSQAGNGVAGWGWNLIGLSSITTGGKSKEIDGITIGAQFNGDDPYYLDGQRLLQVSPNIFETERYSKIKIEKQAVGSSFSFIVKYTDGKIAKYKQLTTGQHYISEMIDAMNNRIFYSYSTLFNVPILTSISYGGTNFSNNTFFIDFIYINKSVPVKSYRNGIEYKSTKVLSEIKVRSTLITSNSGLYRKYKLTFDKIQGNTVERLIKIELENENGVSLKPLQFGYNLSQTGNVEITTNSLSSLPSGHDYQYSQEIFHTKGLGSVAVGDFYGTGIPYPIYETKYTNSLFKLFNPKTGLIIDSYTKSRKYFVGKTLNNNKISEYDELLYSYIEYLDGDSNPIDKMTIKSKNLVSGTSKTYTINLPGGFVEEEVMDPYDYENSGYITVNIRDKSEREIISGDFNNDGLVDIFIIENSNISRPQKIYFCEIGKLASGNIIPVEVSNTGLNTNEADFYQVEFDGDGIPEILVVNKANISKYSIYKFNFLSSTLLGIPNQVNITLSNFTSKTPLIFGDYNGDGLTDFLTPQKIYKIEDSKAAIELNKMETEQLLWWEYISTGTTYIKTQKDYTQQKLAYIESSQRNIIKKSSNWDKFWSGKPDSYEYTEYGTSSIIPTDFNNDGKTDLISVRKFGKAIYNLDGKLALTNVENLNAFSYFYYNFQTGSQLINVNPENANKIFFHENKTLSNGTQQLSNLSNSINLSNIKISPLSLIINYTDFNQLNTYKSGILIHDPITRTDRKFLINNEQFNETLIREVNNGSPVSQKIEYRPMVEKSDNLERVYTTKILPLNYPYYTHKNIGGHYLVYKMHTVFDNSIITKEYRYQNGIQHLDGKGFLGFQKTFISDPYESHLVDGKYKMKDPFKGHFWKINTYDPLMDNALIVSTYGSLNENSIFSKNTLTYEKYYFGTNSYLIQTKLEINKDFLKNLTITKSFEYENNFLLKQVNINYNGTGSSIEKFFYKPEFSNGDHYFFGKIEKTEKTAIKGSDIFITKEEQYFNPNGTVQQTKEYGNGTQPIISEFTYYPFGGIQTQTIYTSGVNPVTTTFEYDSTNRFLWKTTSPEGLISITNTNVLGRVINETSPLGHLTSYRYDNWGNVKEITDFLGKKTFIKKNITPSEHLGYYSISTKREGGVESIVIMDIFDRAIKTKSKTINDQWVINEVEYDIFGKKIKQSEPYFEGETVLWNTIEYDELDRPVKHTSFNGKIITTCYEGLKVSVVDGHKKTSKWVDAMGNVVKHQDQGGEIYYTYYPNGSLKETNYDGIKTKIEIDGWGNKTKLIDPSAGTYIYEYDNMSRIKKEINPKGGITQYNYDSFGKLISETTNSPTENTTINKNYTYDSTTKLPTIVSGTYNGKNYTYTTFYNDPYFRVTGKKEETPDFTYETTINYDSFGRVDITEQKTTLNNPSYITIAQVKNVYDGNGILTSQLDNQNNTLIWQVNSINSHGLTTQMQYGNGYTLNTTYNSSNFLLENIHHFNDNQSVLNINFNYDNLKGVLLSRNNLVFGKNETYQYDDLNRLLEEATNGVVVQRYTYDKRGRMTSNTDIGEYKYNEQDYKLQSIKFNPNGVSVNTNRGFAEIQYNAFKNPNEIYLAGKDRISYDYSILKTRSVSYYGSLATTPSDRPNRKYYSADKTIEITKEGTITKIVTYITGDAYSANYMKVDILNGSSVLSNDKYFLHRDNQATILAITKADVNGTIIERRYFDAWGNLKEAKIGNSNAVVLPNAMGWINQLLIDRGYTGHEHLKTVGLIHMNGRIYDPLLRRFMSPDNYVQDPYNTQNYNRYGYVWNNPLLYVDPSGEFGIIAAILIGAAVGILTNGINNSINGVPFWYGAGKAGLIGGISGAISFGIGSVATDVFGQYLTTGKALFQAYAHGFTGAFMSSIEGGNFGSGFAAGALSSLVSSAIGLIGESGGMYLDDEYTRWTDFGSQNPSLMKAITLVSGGLSGGLGSTISGGNFWQGARQGLISSGLNHLAHGLQQLKQVNDLKEFLKEYYAIIAGESSDNSLEAQGIGEVILRRIKHVGADYDKNFISKIGGKNQYDAIDGIEYKAIKAMSLKQIESLKSTDPYYYRIEGAKNAFFSNNSNVSNGAYFWNSTAQKNWTDKGFNWRAYDRGLYIISAEIGGTTFFKYKDTNKKWP